MFKICIFEEEKTGRISLNYLLIAELRILWKNYFTKEFLQSSKKV